MANLFSSIIDGDVTIGVYLICIVTAFLCGVITAFAASFKSKVTKSFVIALVLLPAIVCTVITMVNGNIGTGVAVAGAFSLVRFRSAAGKAKDIVGIFLAMTAGLACAAGYVVIAVLFTLLVAAVMMAAVRIPLGNDKSMHLHITVPESLNFAEMFEDLFAIYTSDHKLIKVKTSNMGSLYKLFYEVEMKEPAKMQEFIDKLRCRNGNLEIMMAEAATEGNDEL